MTELKVYSIPEMNYSELETKLSKLNKKAIKLNCEPIVLTLLGTVDLKISVPWQNNQILVRHNQVTISGVAPIIAGYELIASCEQFENGILVKTIPGKTYPERYRDLMSCEHCNSNRLRKYTFIVRNVETDEYKMVGKSCLKDFLGHMDPNFYAMILQYLAEFNEKEYSEIPSGFRTLYNTEEYLSFVAACIRERGWISKTNANEQQTLSTANFAEEAITNYHAPSKLQDKFTKYPEPTEQDKELANKSLNWAKNLVDTKNDYLYNIHLLSQQNSISYKEMGFVASIVSSFAKNLEYEILKEQRETAKKQELLSDYFGSIGEKIQIELTYVNSYSFETQWGMSHINKFLDQNGNIFIWKSSNSVRVNQGQLVKIKGTIKDHSEYAGAKQTILTRCKIA